MNFKPIRALLLLTDNGMGQELHFQLDELESIEVVQIARSQRSALKQVESAQLDILVVDLMLPDYRSIDVISKVGTTNPEIRILALSPGDVPHDRILLAIHAGALGFITRDASLDDISEAIQQVHQGNYWLPLEDTYDVLGDAAGELVVTAQEQQVRLSQVLLGLIPLTGIVTAFTAFLWREYWGQIGVRVVDLGVDPTTRMIDVLSAILMVIVIFGPLLFVKSWVEAISQWIENERPSIAKAVAKARQWRLGKLILNNWVARGLLALTLLTVLIYLARIMPHVMVVFFGPVVGFILLANILDLDQELPDVLRLPQGDSRRVFIYLSVVVIIFLVILGTEVWIKGPDLRTDGLHGVLAPEVLGFQARPITLYDLDGNLPPLGALYLGGNADLYVLYDPCSETTRLVPVGSSRVELVDQVICRSQE